MARRGGESVREREALRAALSALTSPCPFCDCCAAALLWSPDRLRYIVRVYHARACPTQGKRSAVFRRDATDYLVSLLRWYGAAIGDYCESDLVESHAPGCW